MKKRIIAIGVVGLAGLGALANSGPSIDQEKVDLAYDTAYQKTYEAEQPKLYENAALLSAFMSENLETPHTTAGFDAHMDRESIFRRHKAKLSGVSTDFKTGLTTIQVSMPDNLSKSYKVTSELMSRGVAGATGRLHENAAFDGMEAAQAAAPDAPNVEPTSRYGAVERNKQRWLNQIKSYHYSRG